MEEEEEDEYMEDAYIGAEDYYAECDSDFYGEEVVDFSDEANSIASEFCGDEESDFAYTTSYDEDLSQCSGYEESSY